MNSEDFTSKIQKCAFSYIELIITMALVVVVIIMSAPFLSGMSKKDVMQTGQYICYARFIDNGWKLFENVRYNTDAFPAEDSEVTERGCEFYKPNGNIVNYQITLVGGGGSGSMPYFASADNQYINVAAGQDGANGEKKENTDSLENLFDDGTLNIRLCSDDSSEDVKACVGKGGELVKNYDTAYVTVERLKKISESLENGTFSAMDISFMKKIEDNSITSALLTYQNNKTSQNKKTLISRISNYILPDTNKNSGRSGGSTKIKLSSGEMFVAKGGLYGLSDPNKENFLFDKNSEYSGNIDNKYYYIPKDKLPKPYVSGDVYKNCDGKDMNERTNETRFKYYGEGGKAGAFICRLPSDMQDLSEVQLSEGNNNKTVQKRCYACKGGRGAGGAIIITW